MPMIQPDFTEVPKPLEGGTYPAKIVRAEPGVSQAGNPKVVVYLAVTGPNGDVERQQHLGITGPGARGFRALLRAIGLSEGPLDTDDLVGTSLQVVVVPDMYGGELSDKITGYLPA